MEISETEIIPKGSSDKEEILKEIQDQMQISMSKMANVLYQSGYDLTKPIKP